MHTLYQFHLSGNCYKVRLTARHASIPIALQDVDIIGGETRGHAFLKLNPNDLTVIIPHQSNARIMESARDRLGLPTDKLYINIDRYGNTSAASVPICLHELSQQGRVKAGDYVLFVALGGGLTWATSLWKV